MKKVILFCMFALVANMGAMAQKTVSVQKMVRDTQARMLDMQSNGYVTPLLVDLEVIKNPSDHVEGSNGRTRILWGLTAEQFEFEMNRDIVNTRSYAVFLSCKHYKCDVLVGATFNFRTATADDKGGVALDVNGKPMNNPDYIIEVTGFPANFNNFRVAGTGNKTNSDFQWIQLEKLKTTSEADKINPLVK